MTLEILTNLFDRELNKLKHEIELYPDPKLLWLIDQDILNSGGNLALHLIGNLNNYIGKELGATGYIRNRELEFSQKDVPQAELVQMIENTRKVVTDTLNKLNESELENRYPLIVFEKEMTTGYFLMHLLAHLTYHLGQINYHRRLIGITIERTV